MDHTKITFLAAVLVVLIITASNTVIIPEVSEITGALIYTPPGKEESTYRYELNDWVNGFYQIRGVKWPRGSCTGIAKELYEFLVYGPLTVTEDFSTFGPERISNVVYGLEQEHAGAMELVYGQDLLKGYNVDSAMHIYAESVVRIPHADRASEIHIDIFGDSNDVFEVKYGAIKMPTLRCAFETIGDEAVCDCEYVHEQEYRY